ncbi:MAG: DUF362 domain-containing protein [Salinivirgaceae bacterium]
MHTAKVYFTSLRAKPNQNLLQKLSKLMDKAGFSTLPVQDKFTALKIHFGEPGNLAFIRPNFAAEVVKKVKSAGGKPFLTDANTLYSGKRSNAVDHLLSATQNGFTEAVVGCPIIIADGLKGTDQKEIAVNLTHTGTARISAAIAEADIIISMTHFKGHEMAGFGGTLKNLGMGAASVAGKLFLHSTSKPKIEVENCTGCNACVKNCAHNAIQLNADKKALIDYETCVGCGQCVAICQFDAAQVVWENASALMNEKVAEYTAAILKNKPALHISFVMDVSPDCDCWGYNDYPMVPNIGIAASLDPVALDKACADLVTAAPVLNQSAIANKTPEKESHCNLDKFKMAHPNTNWMAGLLHAEKIGLGTLNYELINV